MHEVLAAGAAWRNLGHRHTNLGVDIRVDMCVDTCADMRVGMRADTQPCV